LQEGVAAVFRPVGNFFSNVFRAGSLAEEVERLTAENQRIGQELQQSATDRAENEEYESILQIAEEQKLDIIGATVIGESPSNFEWAVSIDKGSQDGVDEDMAVIGPSGLVGPDRRRGQG
jgi:rod shape-determining protein MreC